MSIARVRIAVCARAVAGDPPAHDELLAGLRAVKREFPTVALDVESNGSGSRETPPPVPVDVERWDREDREVRALDQRINELAPRSAVCVRVCGRSERVPPTLLQILTRWQRHVERRNDHSNTPLFKLFLGRLSDLHDRSKPLVAADWDHALDTWQWLLRLSPQASAVAQMAALLHDVERLESEADARVEHLAPSYALFKASHARRGAAIAESFLRRCDVDVATCAEVADLIVAHERSDGRPDAELLNDADALSFFSLNSSGYLDYFGERQTERKIVYSLGRMRAAAATRLESVRLRGDVATLLRRAQGGRARPLGFEGRR